MKQKLLFFLTALMLLTTGNAWGDVVPVYIQDFESASTEKGSAGSNFGITGATLTGNGAILTGDPKFGKYYKNAYEVASQSNRANYLTLTTTAFTGMTDPKATTISFWVNAYGAWNNHWGSIFVAYGAGGNTSHGYPFSFDTRACLAVHSSLYETYFDNNGIEANDWRTSGTDFASSWHHVALVYSLDESDANNKKVVIKQYIDGTLKQTYNLENGNADHKDVSMFDHFEQLTEYVIGGNSPVWNDPDNNYAYDEIAVYSQALSPAQIQKIIFDKDPAAYIAEKKGDLTSIINGDFQVDASGWSGGNLVTVVPTRSWRGTSYANNFYETNYTSNMEYVLNDMPAGTYKVVAAARAWDGTITAKLNGTIGTHYDGIGDLATLGAPEINLNGVQMPYSNLGGFTSDDTGHNWRWIYATATLAEAGTLTITFNAESNSGDWRWMCIDDVYLYCTKLGETNYTKTVRDNTTAFNPADKVATADIIFENPNKVLRTSTNYITTAAGQPMNNDQYGSTSITKLVLYDGYEFSKMSDEIIGNAVLYRHISANTWCTLCVPFWPTTSLTMKYPSELSNGTLNFSDVERTTWGGVDKPMLIKSTTELNAIEGKIASTGGGGSGANHNDLTSGEGAPMVGTYSNIADLSAVTGTNYVVGTDGKLHKVTGAVTVAPFRAYFNIAESEARNVISMNFDGGYTGINTIEAAETKSSVLKDGKYLIEGKIILVKNGVKYGANGQKLN